MCGARGLNKHAGPLRAQRIKQPPQDFCPQKNRGGSLQDLPLFPQVT